MANMAYVNPRYVPEDKTSELEKRQLAWKSILMQNRKVMPETQSYRRRAGIINQGGLDATNFESKLRTMREQAYINRQQRNLQNMQAQQFNVNLPGRNIQGWTPGNVSGGVYKGGNPTDSFIPVKGGGSFDAFMGAISGQESGGNYSSRNSSSGAMGKYQIMPGNIQGSHRGWDFEALGRDITTAQFMASPQLQEAIARYKLQQYYKKWGARGAAIAWYAGPGAVGRVGGNKSQGAYPTINQYANSILRRMGL